MEGLEELDAIYSNQCPHCFELGFRDFLNTQYLNATSILNEVVEDIYQGNTDTVNAKLFNLYNNNLKKGVAQVFNRNSSDRTELDYLYKFEANAAKFAAYKSAYVAKTLRELNEKDREHFKEKAKNTLKRFNRYQVSEYTTLVARCRTAKQFTQFSRMSDKFPNLEWVRSRSASPRELHLQFAGLVLPITDAFWSRHQPGDLYGCKCDVKQSRKPLTVVPDEADKVVPSVGLEGNPFRTRVAYTEKHPYFSEKRIGGKERSEVDTYVQNHLLGYFRNDKGALIAPFGDYANDLNDLRVIAKHFADSGEKVYIMPKITHFDNDLYKCLFRGAYSKKCPDLLVGEKYFEYESYVVLKEKETLSKMVKNGLYQASNIIVDLRGTNYSYENYKKLLSDKIKKGYKIDSAYALTKDEIIKVL